MLGWRNCLCNFVIVFFLHSLDVSTQASTGIISDDEVSGIFKNFPPCVLPTGMDVPSTSIVSFIVFTVIPILPISVSEVSRGISALTMSVLSWVVLPPNVIGRVIDPRDLLGPPLRNLSWPFVVTREISFSVIPSCCGNWLNQDKPETVLTQHVSRRPQLVYLLQQYYRSGHQNYCCMLEMYPLHINWNHLHNHLCHQIYHWSHHRGVTYFVNQISHQ